MNDNTRREPTDHSSPAARGDDPFSLEAYLARPDVTDIFVVGHDNVRVRTVDGREQRVAPVAASDADLVDQIQALARKGGRLGLDDGTTQIETPSARRV